MKKDKLDVLICIDWFLPAFKAGGPIQSVSNLVEYFKDEFDFWIFTSNADIDGTLNREKVNCWVEKDGYKVMYSSSENKKTNLIKTVLNTHSFDVIYLNSLYSYNFTLIPLWLLKSSNRRIVLAPRGMLGKGALEIKFFKKKLFILFFRLLGFHKKIIWHATDDTEKDEINRHFGSKVRVVLAPNLIGKSNFEFYSKTKISGEIKMFFLSRISAKKNLLYALDVISRLNIKTKIDFSIIGPVEEVNYWNDCLKCIKLLPKNINVNILGPIPNYKLQSILKDHHLLILPTKHENFGHVILESLQAGCPVIISKYTPWQNLKSKNIGFDIPLNDSKKFISSIKSFIKMDSIEFNKWSLNSFNFAKTFSENKPLIDKSRKIFENE